MKSLFILLLSLFCLTANAHQAEVVGVSIGNVYFPANSTATCQSFAPDAEVVVYLRQISGFKALADISVVYTLVAATGTSGSIVYQGPYTNNPGGLTIEDRFEPDSPQNTYGVDIPFKQRDIDNNKIYALHLGRLNLTGLSQYTLGFRTSVCYNNQCDTNTNNNNSVALCGTTTAAPTPLPVELTKFTVTPTMYDVRFNWTTALEKNSDYFAVESSSDASTFREIGRVRAAGSSNNTRNYQYNTQHINAKTYYRLRMVDVDATVKYSTVVAVNRITGSDTEYLVGGDSRFIAFRLNSGETPVTVEVRDMAGRLIHSEDYTQTPNFPFNGYSTVILQIVSNTGRRYSKMFR